MLSFELSLGFYPLHMQIVCGCNYSQIKFSQKYRNIDGTLTSLSLLLLYVSSLPKADDKEQCYSRIKQMDTVTFHLPKTGVVL